MNHVALRLTIAGSAQNLIHPPHLPPTTTTPSNIVFTKRSFSFNRIDMFVFSDLNVFNFMIMLILIFSIVATL